MGFVSQAELCVELVSVVDYVWWFRLPWVKGIGKVRKFSHLGHFGPVSAWWMWVFPCSSSILASICQWGSEATQVSLKSPMEWSFSLSGQNGAMAMGWFFYLGTGEDICPEIPVIQLIVASLEIYSSSCICDKALPPDLAGLAHKLNFYQMKTSYLTHLVISFFPTLNFILFVSENFKGCWTFYFHEKPKIFFVI